MARQGTTSPRLRVDASDYSSDDLRDALLVAVAHGWRPRVVPPAAETFEDSEEPTARLRSEFPAGLPVIP